MDWYVSHRKTTMMIDDQLARAHRNNIQRYRFLLQTTLTEFERQFVERRLSEEQSKLDTLTGSGSSDVSCTQENHATQLT
jgi:hypothetical protein